MFYKTIGSLTNLVSLIGARVLGAVPRQKEVSGLVGMLSSCSSFLLPTTTSNTSPCPNHPKEPYVVVSDRHPTAL
jgi:hypothetical protein